MAAKAASSSLSVLAVSTSRCCLRRSAAARISGSSVLMFTLPGFESNAIVSAAGRSSCNSSTRFGPRTLKKTLIPVRLPVGLLRLSTRPTLTGSAPVMKTMGIVLVAAFAANGARLLAIANGSPSVIILTFEQRRDAQNIIAPERGSLEFQAQFAGALPRIMKLCARWSTSDLGIFLPVLVARRIAEIVGMELYHHVHRRRRHVFSNPFQRRIGAAFDMIEHHQVSNGKISSRRTISSNAQQVRRGGNA